MCICVEPFAALGRDSNGIPSTSKIATALASVAAFVEHPNCPAATPESDKQTSIG